MDTENNTIASPYSGFSLYRRDLEPIIRDEFNNYGYDQSELSINDNCIVMMMNTFGLQPTGAEGLKAWEETKSTDSSGATYWSLYANRTSSVTIDLIWWLLYTKYGGKKPDFLEFKFDVGVFGPGECKVYVSNFENIDVQHNPVNNVNGLIEKFYGPTAWQISDYHRLEQGQKIQFVYTPKGQSDPIPRCELDNLIFYAYNKINAEFVKLGPMRSDTSPKKLDVIQGFYALQTIERISTTADVQIRFLDTPSYLDFISHAEYPHVIVDESNVLYRGVFDLQEDEHYGSGIHEIKAKFYSPCKLGVGWK